MPDLDRFLADHAQVEAELERRQVQMEHIRQLIDAALELNRQGQDVKWCLKRLKVLVG